MKKILLGIGGLILGGLVGGLMWTPLAFLLKSVFTLTLAAAGGYLGYQYGKRLETPQNRWRD